MAKRSGASNLRTHHLLDGVEHRVRENVTTVNTLPVDQYKMKLGVVLIGRPQRCCIACRQPIVEPIRRGFLPNGAISIAYKLEGTRYERRGRRRSLLESTNDVPALVVIDLQNEFLDSQSGRFPILLSSKTTLFANLALPPFRTAEGTSSGSSPSGYQNSNTTTTTNVPQVDCRSK